MRRLFIFHAFMSRVTTFDDRGYKSISSIVKYFITGDYDVLFMDVCTSFYNKVQQLMQCEDVCHEWV